MNLTEQRELFFKIIWDRQYTGSRREYILEQRDVWLQTHNVNPQKADETIYARVTEDYLQWKKTDNTLTN